MTDLLHGRLRVHVETTPLVAWPLGVLLEVHVEDEVRTTLPCSPQVPLGLGLDVQCGVQLPLLVGRQVCVPLWLLVLLTVSVGTTLLVREGVPCPLPVGVAVGTALAVLVVVGDGSLEVVVEVGCNVAVTLGVAVGCGGGTAVRSLSVSSTLFANRMMSSTQHAPNKLFFIIIIKSVNLHFHVSMAYQKQNRCPRPRQTHITHKHNTPMKWNHVTNQSFSS